MSLKGKTALITGSTSGIGLGIAKSFAQEGINIVMNGFGDANTVERERATLEKHGIKATYNPADMTKPHEITALVEEAEDTFGSIDILVNNAGIQHVSPIEDFPPEKWDAVIGINLSSTFHTTRLALPGMKKAGWGRIINIGSIHSLVASANKAAYVAAKFGVLGMTKTVALETAQNNITCNCICPAYVNTPLVQGQVPAQAKAHNIPEDEVIEKIMLAPQPIKKLVQTQHLGEFCLFLCSDAAQNITGAALPIDGGWTAA
jgi:3-hydroxybutyrate dehydrogenase